MTFKTAKERFEAAQALALEADNDFNELIAIGLQELTAAMARDLRDIKHDLDELKRQVRGLH